MQSLRLARGARGLSAIVILILALGIGLTTAMFTLLNGVLLESLPYRDPSRLVRFYGVWPNSSREGTSTPDFADYLQAASFESLAAATKFTPLYQSPGSDGPEQLTGRAVSSRFLETLGFKPAAGTEFAAADERQNSTPRCLISFALWQRRFGGDPAVIGRTISLNDRTYSIIGVMPRIYNFLGATDLWTPLKTDNPAPRNIRFLVMFGRLRNAVGLESAQSEMTLMSRRLEQRYPSSNQSWGIAVRPLSESVTGNVREGLFILMGAVGLVLLIIVLNVAGLMVAWVTVRSHDFAMRAALGASMSRLSGEILAFSMTLAVPGGLAGSLLAVYSLDLVKRLAPLQLPRLDTTSGDWRTPLMALVLAAVCALAMSVFPLLHVRRARLGLSGTRVSGSRQRLNGALVIMEVALSAVLLISASLLIRSAQKLAQVNPGFRTSRILVAPFSLPATRYRTAESRAAFWNRLVEQLRTVPGVEDASFTTEAPLSGVNNPTPFGAITEDGKSHVFYARGVTPGYLEMMGIPLREGSSITRDHRAGTPRVVVINETMRRDLFGTANPIGRKLSFDFEAAPAVIAGVVGDIRHDSLRATPFREAYFPMEQNPLNTFDLMVRTASDPNSIVAGVREAVRAVDPRQAIGPVATLDDYIARDLAQPRFRGFMLALFATLAVALASLGLYGVISYLVAQRTKEVGIRMALGATRARVIQLILTLGGRLVGTGLVAGLAAAWGLTRLLSSSIFGISLRDPLTFASASLILVATSLAACYVPARRASRLDPAKVLQNER